MEIEFQLLDIKDHTESTASGHRFYILLFGKTRNGEDVYVKIEDFKPYFLIKIPRIWKSDHMEEIVDILKRKLEWKHRDSNKYKYDIASGLYRYRLVTMKQLYGFRAGKEFQFIKMEFNSKQAMNEYFYMFNKPLDVFGMEKTFKIFEKNVEPHLRFLHVSKLKSCGWCKFNTSDATNIKNIESYTDHAYRLNYRKIHAFESTDVAPLKILGYDIECVSGDAGFPQPTRSSDKIIQIGLTLYQNGSYECKESYILTLKKIEKIRNAKVCCYKNERGLLLGFAEKIREIRPDIICGYNNFIFDDDYIYKRVSLISQNLEKKRKTKKLPGDLTFESKFMNILGKLNNYNISMNYGYEKPSDNRNIIDKSKSTTHFIDKVIQSKAMGDNLFKYFDIPGIISIDLMKVVKKLDSLQSYSLDYVSSHYINEKIKKTELIQKTDNGKVIVNICTSSVKGLDEGSFIQLLVHDGMQQESMIGDGITQKYKYKVRKIEISKEISKIQIKIPEDHYNVLINCEEQIKKDTAMKMLWSFAKDDVHYTEMNKFFWNYNPRGLKTVAKYCIKDCKLVNILVEKLQLVINNISMAQVCVVPFTYLLMRGQSIKAFSLIANRCLQENIAVNMVKINGKEPEEEIDDYYEGAEVLDPIPGFYKDPVAVLDYNSLYPSSIIESNLSFETHVDNLKYLNYPGYKYFKHEITIRDRDKNIVYENGKPKIKINIFAYKEDENGKIIKGVLPSILDNLLTERKAVKNKKTDDEFLKAVYNSLQLAFKVVANSLYGQTGAKTSPVYKLEIAETTTFIGRSRLKFAMTVVKQDMDAKVIYGDTDSIFVIFKMPKYETEHETLMSCIAEGKKAEALINSKVPKPQKIEFEKIYLRMILVSKKKYTAIKLANNEQEYLANPNGYIHTMGMIQKRRDNAPITKIIAGGLINTLVKTGDQIVTINYIRNCLEKLVKGEYGLDKFVFSKTLKANYANPKTVGHKALADRMGLRDPGNKPQPGDRIPFVFIHRFTHNSKKKKLMGDLIEHPQFLIENNLKIDYNHYLLNQIMNPACQILSLLMKYGKDVEFINQYSKILINNANKQSSILTWSKNKEYKVRNIADIKENLNESFEIKEKKEVKEDMTKWITKGNITKVAKKKKKRTTKSNIGFKW